jgi:hypothetical protein
MTDREYGIHEYEYASKYFIDRIYYSSVDANLTNLVKERSNKTRQDYRSKLAGDIQRQFLLYSIPDNFNIIGDNGINDINAMLENHLRNIMKDDYIEHELVDLWVNFQEKYEFNPVHDHGGTFSFVWYLDIPEEIRKEHLESVGTAQCRGLIQFASTFTPEQMTFNPKTNDILIFRSSQMHQVYPFYSDATRVSVSGNIAI